MYKLVLYGELGEVTEEAGSENGKDVREFIVVAVGPDHDIDWSGSIEVKPSWLEEVK